MSTWVREGVWVRAVIGGPFDAMLVDNGRRSLPRETGIVHCYAKKWSVNSGAHYLNGYDSPERLAVEWEPIAEPSHDGTYPPSLEERFTEALGYVPTPSVMARLVVVVRGQS